ncbi:MAG TPA: PadR family transcriptional regulator [Propionicimonas sp.]|nr:PadR family transcriptional regulator [Propionicimonas sp.]HQA78785.1 PadR family transcriptional regulator [Propionicimonas sp.]HQD96074.1 PadR family transcriptional regulator [Propionicimonas sp.]
MTETPWPTEWLRGVLEVCVLAVIDRGPTYGYAISAELAAAGLGDLKGGTLYPLLGRCEQAGWVAVEWRVGESGPGRKYYTLTPSGRTELRGRASRWHEFVDVTGSLLAASELKEKS